MSATPFRRDLRRTKHREFHARIAAQLKAPTIGGHNSRPNFGKFLAARGLLFDERHAIYWQVKGKRGTATRERVIAEVLAKRPVAALPAGQTYMAVCGFNGFASMHGVEFASWTEAQAHVDAHARSNNRCPAAVHVRTIGSAVCVRCGCEQPAIKPGFFACCQPCMDTWPRVSPEEMCELAEQEEEDMHRTSADWDALAAGVEDDE